MESRKSIDVTAIGLMTVICLVWAMQQIGLKATEDLAAPIYQIGIRSGIAAACLFAVVALKGGTIPLTGRVALLGVVAGGLFSLEFLLVGEALRHTSAAHVVVFLYTAPIFAALGLHWHSPSERLSTLQWGGIALAGAGIVYAFLAPSGTPDEAVRWKSLLWGDGLATLAGAVWGLTTIVIRTTRLSAIPATNVLFYQLAGAFVVLTGMAWSTGQTQFSISMPLIANLVFQTAIVSLASFIAWFWMLTKYRASQLGVFSFMTPIFGVLLGVVLLGEHLAQEFVTGACAVITGIVIVSASPWLVQVIVSRLLPIVRNQFHQFTGRAL
ncbi:DMT family transporter [Sinorhizobium sp. BG8]|uniref:DMT family transporter n=1 Tax=Sinorhizobium sp. BG8 TaxID=2613773 RepID=UPI00193D6C2F|nr:DMT family transporter [Sinorhizobium sp. BG8]QRM57186.1 DMT family transporter [Sinorhizobium sp. BG8]